MTEEKSIEKSISSQSEARFNLEPTDSERDIYCCITACNETEAEVALSLNMFKYSNMPDVQLRKRIHLFIFLDRQRDHEPDTITFRAYQKLLNLKVDPGGTYSSCIQEEGCRVFHGFLDDIPYSLYVKGDNLVSGRRYSHLVFAYVVEKMAQRSNYSPSYILTLDCDTAARGKDVQCLIDTLEADPNCGGATGLLKVEYLDFTNIVILLQGTRYFYGQIIEKAADTLFGKCTCLPGAFSLFRYSAIVRCLDRYSVTPRDDDFNGVNCLELGEDRYLTTLLIQQGYNTYYVQKAIAQTVTPDTLDSYITQQRRWMQSTISNQALLLFDKNSSLIRKSKWGIIQWLVILAQFFVNLLPVGIAAMYASGGNIFGDLLPPICYALIIWLYSVIFTFSVINRAMNEIYPWLVFNVFLWTFLMWYGVCGHIASYLNQGRYSTIIDTIITVIIALIIMGIVLTLRLTFKFAKPKERLPLLVGFLLAYLFCGIFTVIPLCAFANMDNRSWGTRGITHETEEISQTDLTLEDLPFVKGSSSWKAARASRFMSNYSKKLIFVALILILNLIFILLFVGMDYQKPLTGLVMCFLVTGAVSPLQLLLSYRYHVGKRRDLSQNRTRESFSAS